MGAACGRLLMERSVRAVGVVMLDVLAQRLFPGRERAERAELATALLLAMEANGVARVRIPLRSTSVRRRNGLLEAVKTPGGR